MKTCIHYHHAIRAVGCGLVHVMMGNKGTGHGTLSANSYINNWYIVTHTQC